MNIHHWDDISFLHWRVDPDELRDVVPDALTILTHDGGAWVGVTPFFIRVRPPGIPVVPPGWAFPETNVRTYVAGPDGREGLWFLHMEVTARWFVATLRALGLPYVRQRMRVDATPERRLYRSRPGRLRSGGGHDILVRPGVALSPSSGRERERFLTARWGAYHRRGPALLYTPVEHPAWALREAEVETVEVSGLFEAAGLPPPDGAPLVHYSTGVEVKVGPPQLVRDSPA